MANETLDAYEEGTFTIGFSGTTIDARAHTTAHYTKIGDIVFFLYYSGAMTLSSSTGAAHITGLPFTSANTANRYGQFTTVHGNAVDGGPSTGGYIDLNSTQGPFIDSGNTTGASWINTSGAYVMVQGWYHVA